MTREKSTAKTLLLVMGFMTFTCGLLLAQYRYETSKDSAACLVWETTVPVEGAGGVVTSVTIRREASGELSSSWATTLPAGTKTQLSLGLWKPDPAGGIPHGPSRGQTKATVGDGAVSPAEHFSNRGGAHPAGEYYLGLAVHANGAWEQPSRTVKFLEESKDDGIKDDLGGDPSLGGLARFILPSCSPQ